MKPEGLQKDKDASKDTHPNFSGNPVCCSFRQAKGLVYHLHCQRRTESWQTETGTINLGKVLSGRLWQGRVKHVHLLDILLLTSHVRKTRGAPNGRYIDTPGTLRGLTQPWDCRAAARSSAASLL